MSNLAYLTEQYYRHHYAVKSRKNTLRWHRQAHTYFFRVCGIQSIESINREVINNFIAIKSEEGKSAETIRSYVRSVKALCKWLYEEEFINVDIFRKRIRLPKLEERTLKLICRSDLKKITNSLEVFPYYRDELERLRTKALFAIYMHTGMRKTEALQLLMSDIKLHERTLFIRTSKTREPRNVIVNDELYDILAEYCDYLSDLKLKNEYLFFINDPKLPMSQDALRYIKERIENFARRRFKIKKFTIHMFRHSYISYGIADGLPIPFVMNQVGHTQITTTQGYTHLPEKEMVHKLSSYSVTHGTPKE